MRSQRFLATLAAGRASLLVPVPFNPDQVWGAKPRHHVTGTVNAIRVRAVIEPVGEGFGFTLGPKSPSRPGLTAGDEVTVDIAPEGPQRADLADDVPDALAAHPEAAAFFDSLAQFYHRAYLRWIDATKRARNSVPHGSRKWCDCSNPGSNSAPDVRRTRLGAPSHHGCRTRPPSQGARGPAPTLPGPARREAYGVTV